jgi:hypothetical protein
MTNKYDSLLVAGLDDWLHIADIAHYLQLPSDRSGYADELAAAVEELLDEGLVTIGEVTCIPVTSAGLRTRRLAMLVRASCSIEMNRELGENQTYFAPTGRRFVSLARLVQILDRASRLRHEQAELYERASAIPASGRPVAGRRRSGASQAARSSRIHWAAIRETSGRSAPRPSGVRTSPPSHRCWSSDRY